MSVKVGGKPVEVTGGILVWGATTPAGCDAVRAEHGFADVVSVEDMVRDLRLWDATHWRDRVSELRTWTTELFDGLV